MKFCTSELPLQAPQQTFPVEDLARSPALVEEPTESDKNTDPAEGGTVESRFLKRMGEREEGEREDEDAVGEKECSQYRPVTTFLNPAR